MARSLLRSSLVVGLLAVTALIPTAHAGQPGVVDPTVPAARDTDPVVLTGKDLTAGSSVWAVPENQTAAVPSKDIVCFAQEASTDCGPDAYNHYVDPDADTSGAQNQIPVTGTPVDKILGYRWDGAKFVQIPFQVDEVFTRYLNNDYSGFGIYSGTDKHTTYAYDREGFRFTQNGSTDPESPDFCKATPKDGISTTADPIKGLDSNDELAFMASDAGAQAPSTAALPSGIDGVKVVTIADPSNPTAAPQYVYVMRAAANGPKPAFDASNGYVQYKHDENFNTLVYAQSSYDSYGPAIQGPYCTADGKPVLDAAGKPRVGPRKEVDTVTISTRRYQFRYDGRWLMTRVQIAQTPQNPFSDDKAYGPDLVDRWKARAFAQDPGSKTPCCGYEEEDTNWGGSSSLLGERVGPVRAIRETWGADSGTNVIRRETFYRDRMVQKNWLRVHVIPPLDGIYAQWDYNAGRVTKFFNANNPTGIDVDGKNDEVYGNFDDPCNPRWDGNDRTQIDSTYRQAYKQAGLCTAPGLSGEEHASIDPGDATFAEANASLGWSEVAGPTGAIVDRIHAQVTDETPGGLAQGLAAVPYYRDDACFDDGTGADPGPELFPRQFDREQSSKGPDGSARKCWTRNDGPTNAAGGDRGNSKFWQGDIGTHGLHLLFQLDSDNARTTVPVDEIVSDWDLIMLPPSQTLDSAGQPKNVGEQYGRATEKPLVTVTSEMP